MRNNIFSVKQTSTHSVYKILGVKLSIPICIEDDEQNNTAFIESQTKIVQANYEKILMRIKAKRGKIKVLFYVFEISKWKTDTLYKLLQNDDRFDPIIVLGVVPLRIKKYNKQFKVEKIKSQMEYFKNKGYNIEVGFNIETNKNISLEKFSPDIVFFQQHLGNSRENYIDKVSKYALCCYVPYNVPNYGYVNHDYTEFCSKLFRFYCLNEQLKQYYEEQKPYAHNIKAVGHTALDLFYLNRNKASENKYIIYAPHFSIMHPLNRNKFYYATIGQNGKFILDYAKKHPEYTWVFKPHPNLREALININVPENIVDEYYKEWQKIGIVCEDSDYYEYFINSKVMLTDCGSFLTEYFCTGKPLIHMINDKTVNWPCRAMRPMYDSFYETNNNQELLTTLDKIIEKNEDYKKEQREIVSKELHFSEQYAAKNILEDIEKTLGLQKTS